MITNEQMDALPEPCAVRHSYDGYGWLYSDNGNGSFWLERAMEMPDAEPVYSAATVIEQQREIERLREALEQAAEQMEDDASLIEHEYGSPVRSLLQLIETGHMPAAYYAARKALGATQ